MHSEVRSSIHIMTANKPSTKVERHKTTKKATNFQDSIKSTTGSSTTNDFLRKGGILPPVLPAAERFCSKICSPQESKTNTRKQIRHQNSNRQPPRRAASVVSHTKKLDSPICNESNIHSDLEVHHQSSCHLEKKVEHLSDKISRVQDIILSQMMADSNMKQDTTKNVASFSARDYKLLVLEMNGNVPLKPYDPNDFSEKEERSLTDSAPRGCLAGTQTTSKSAMLLEIHNELNTWRAAQRHASHEQM
ncbi:uncharacterized protein LOC113212435 isoform X1 [Frankliniella occidentalis]|uniref:Uncharacterized protein LOC113212435 isoform X1 n=1 Tax=Frankliniella occidentalis TaxID=133901 RepID=A0A6J1T061_FRAOC|nr:uncharacterized protein LOC113212435 isoform X1 [Frankliniella occidentalis]XP_026286907.1 uncharacterized protein LOC113212435 isoform X1 [Frankliniella occidentalis]XP_026286908.1 uncharacterized protein LOC113212435 isoform X1 [Frankliniella occidentalis]XP_026286909.1 uncharacterized protein LOC113212435 isoform X1 [Frankliniella occidentalis]